MSALHKLYFFVLCNPNTDTNTNTPNKNNNALTTLRQVTEAEHVYMSEFWKEHAWGISELPYDKPQKDGHVERRRSLQYIGAALGHTGREIKYIKSDLQGREWILLKQILANLKLMDVRQVSENSHHIIYFSKRSSSKASLT